MAIAAAKAATTDFITFKAGITLKARSSWIVAFSFRRNCELCGADRAALCAPDVDCRSPIKIGHLGRDAALRKFAFRARPSVQAGLSGKVAPTCSNDYRTTSAGCAGPRCAPGSGNAALAR